jgi:hypothetical protein
VPHIPFVPSPAKAAAAGTDFALWIPTLQADRFNLCTESAEDNTESNTQLGLCKGQEDSLCEGGGYGGRGAGRSNVSNSWKSKGRKGRQRPPHKHTRIFSCVHLSPETARMLDDSDNMKAWTAEDTA